MTSGRIMGWRVVESSRLRWDQAIAEETTRTIVCGEINQIRFIAYLAAWKEACREDLRRALASLAERVGVEYSPSRTTKTP